MGGPKGWGPKKKVPNVEIYVIFEVFAFCGGRTITDFKDRGLAHHTLSLQGSQICQKDNDGIISVIQTKILCLTYLVTKFALDNS